MELAARIIQVCFYFLKDFLEDLPLLPRSLQLTIVMKMTNIKNQGTAWHFRAECTTYPNVKFNLSVQPEREDLVQGSGQL